MSVALDVGPSWRPAGGDAEEIDDILTAPPAWFERWGVAVLTTATVMLLALSWIVRYPDVLQGRVTITSRHPPVPVIARTDGKIVKLLVAEGSHVAAGATLAVIASPADADDMLALDGQIAGWQRDLGLGRQIALPPDERRDLRLGDIQGDFATFVQLVEELKGLLASSAHRQRVAAVGRQASIHRALGNSLREQAELKQETSSLLVAKELGDEILGSRGYIASRAVDDTRREVLGGRFALREVEANRLRNDALVAELKNRVLELEQQRWDRIRALNRGIREALERMRRGLAQWQYLYVLAAPTDGRVTFFDVWTGNQIVRAGKESMFVVPESNEIVGRLPMGQQGVGRAQTGQRVTVELDGFPAYQYGSVTAVVEGISATARADEYVATIGFPDGLRTTFGRDLPFRQGMTAGARVITKDRRLFERLLGPLRYLFGRAGESS
jgi:multidrug resistance efflux pump